MIIYAKGRDKNTPDAPFIIDTKDIIYVKGYDKKGTESVVYLRHNVTEKRNGSESTYPVWIVLDMSVEDFYKMWKEADKYE